MTSSYSRYETCQPDFPISVRIFVPTMSMQFPFATEDERSPQMCFLFTSRMCVGETYRGCMVQWHMASRDQASRIQHFPSPKILIQDIHKSGQPPYLVVIRGDVIEYVLEKYQCSAAEYWKHVDRRQHVISFKSKFC